MGNAGNITAYWKGFREYHKLGKISSLPRMMGWQAAGSAPIVENRVIPDPHTIATAIKIGNPASWQPALEAARESNGRINKVTDDEILCMYSLISRMEGIFVEPASAASLAGVAKAKEAGMIPAGALVTATLTGHGLKDPDRAMQVNGVALVDVEPKIEAVLERLKF